MKALLTLALLASFAPAAHAGLDFVCTRADDADDWRISGTLGAKEINLFDNDADATFVLKAVIKDKYVYEEQSNPKNQIWINKRNIFQANYVWNGDYASPVLFNCQFTN